MRPAAHVQPSRHAVIYGSAATVGGATKSGTNNLTIYIKKFRVKKMGFDIIRQTLQKYFYLLDRSRTVQDAQNL